MRRPGGSPALLLVLVLVVGCIGNWCGPVQAKPGRGGHGFGGPMNGTHPDFNGTRPGDDFNGTRPGCNSTFNGTRPDWNGTLPDFNSSIPRPHGSHGGRGLLGRGMGGGGDRGHGPANGTLPDFNGTHPGHDFNSTRPGCNGTFNGTSNGTRPGWNGTLPDLSSTWAPAGSGSRGKKSRGGRRN